MDFERNPYGDQLKSTLSGFGSDVSSQRISPFEEEILSRAARMLQSSSEPLGALDLFSGCCAANGLRLAELGFTAYAIDFSQPDQSLSPVAGHRLDSGGILYYWQQDVRNIDLTLLQGKLDLVTCQRGLHFLRFHEATRLVAILAGQMKAGASMFFSIGATDCAVGPGYKHTDLPVEDRWHPLEPELGGPIHVTEPLCLYKPEDIAPLFAGPDGELVSVDRDDFGLFVVEFRIK